MADKNDRQVVIRDAQIVWRNSEGKEGMYNAKGNREFSVILPESLAQQLLEDGWNVKRTKEREGDDDEMTGNDPYITISVSFKIKPPRIVMITSGGRTNLSEDMVEVLDYADIEKADLIFNPYDWTVNGKSGVKAYLKSLFVTIEEDELEREYAINAGED